MKKLFGLAVMGLVVWNLLGCGQTTSTLSQQQDSGSLYSYLTIDPGSTSLLLGSSEVFTLYKYTSYGTTNETQAVDPVWTLAGDIGTIAQTGILIATKEGTGYLIASFEGSIEYVSITVTKEVSNATPSVPTGLSISSISSNVALVRWNASSYATNYVLRYHTKPIILNGSTAYSTTSSALLTGLSSNTTYYVQVRAYNNYGNSRYCSAESFKTSN